MSNLCGKQPQSNLVVSHAAQTVSNVILKNISAGFSASMLHCISHAALIKSTEYPI